MLLICSQKHYKYHIIEILDILFWLHVQQEGHSNTKDSLPIWPTLILNGTSS